MYPNLTSTNPNPNPLMIGRRLLIDNINGNGAEGSGTVKVYTDGQKVNKLVSVMGNTENLPCNNRGICDETKGWFDTITTPHTPYQYTP